MKVCYVLSTSEITGGANRSLLDFLSALDRNKVEPLVLIKKHGDIEKVLDKLQITYYMIPYINEISTGNWILDLIKRLISIKTTNQVKQLLAEKKVDLLHNNSLTALAGIQAANELGIPCICHIREQVESGLGLKLLDRRKHFEVIRRASKIIAISKFVCKEYKEELKGKDIIVLQDGFDVSHYLVPERSILCNDEIHIAIYGNLDPQKGQMDAVRAHEMLHKKGYKKIFLHIIGNQKTEYAVRLKKYVIGHKIENIIISEPIKNLKDLKTSRSHMDINLVCSSAEGLGRVTVESMLSCCLTIGANAGATPEIIEDGVTGMMYECGNIQELVSKIEWAIENKSKAEIIAKSGRRSAIAKYDIYNYAHQLMDIYFANSLL